MPDRETDQLLRKAIDAARAGTATAEQLEALVEAADTTLPDPRTVERWLVWFAWRDGSRRWQPGLTSYDLEAAARYDCAAKAASPDYANVTLTGPHMQDLPGTA